MYGGVGGVVMRPCALDAPFEVVGGCDGWAGASRVGGVGAVSGPAQMGAAPKKRRPQGFCRNSFF